MNRETDRVTSRVQWIRGWQRSLKLLLGHPKIDKTSRRGQLQCTRATFDPFFNFLSVSVHFALPSSVKNICSNSAQELCECLCGVRDAQRRHLPEFVVSYRACQLKRIIGLSSRRLVMTGREGWRAGGGRRGGGGGHGWGEETGWGKGGREVLIRVTGHFLRSLWEPQGTKQTHRGNSKRFAVD